MTTHPGREAAASSRPATDASVLRLELVTASCESGVCPTIYRSDRGTLVVQGYTVTAAQVGLDLPGGEQLVEIPIDLLATAARAVSI